MLKIKHTVIAVVIAVHETAIKKISNLKTNKHGAGDLL